jgi:hypothetical protein
MGRLRTQRNKGLETKQFDRYAAILSGLYVAGPPNVVDLKLVPQEYGVLHVGEHRYATSNEMGKRKRFREIAPQPIVCRRHAQFIKRELTEEQHWRIVWAMAKSIGRFQRDQRERNEGLEQKIKEAAGRAIWKALTEIEK